MNKWVDINIYHLNPNMRFYPSKWDSDQQKDFLALLVIWCISQITADIHFDFHAHNDYDLAAANVFSAISAGIHGVHTTVNGLGERAGNVALSSVIGILKDHLEIESSINEKMLNKVSLIVESFSGIRIPANKPLIGANVFTQTCGIHADGDRKDKLYFNKLMPERFGRTRKYALGKTSGKANIKNIGPITAPILYLFLTVLSKTRSVKTPNNVAKIELRRLIILKDLLCTRDMA